MVRHNTPFSKGKLLTVTSFQRAQYGKGGVEESNLTVEKSDKCPLKINNEKSRWQYVL